MVNALHSPIPPFRRLPSEIPNRLSPPALDNLRQNFLCTDALLRNAGILPASPTPTGFINRLPLTACCLATPPAQYPHLTHRTPMSLDRVQRLQQFVDWSAQHITGDEKGQAQIFLDRLLQAFGQPGRLEFVSTKL